MAQHLQTIAGKQRLIRYRYRYRILRLCIFTIIGIAFTLINALTSLTAHAQALQSPQPQSRYRLYHPGLQTHLYTTDLNEYTVLGTRGWNQENEAHRVFNAAGSYNGGLLKPYFRLFNGNLRIHFWTTDRNEYDVLSRVPGYTGESVPLQRQAFVDNRRERKKRAHPARMGL
jgi:hypothetical protein